jgi:hypothetical protein
MEKENNNHWPVAPHELLTTFMGILLKGGSSEPIHTAMEATIRHHQDIKHDLKQSKADAKNPNIVGKVVNFDGCLVGSVTDEQRSPFVVDEQGIKRGVTNV